MAVGYTKEEQRRMDIIAGTKRQGSLLRGKIDVAAEGPAKLIYDLSVNKAKGYIDHLGHAVLESQIHANVAGNFNGGGTGNKPLLGIDSHEGVGLANFPVVECEIVHNVPTEIQGMSLNAMIDLMDGGTSGPIVYATITESLNNNTDIYGKQTTEASITHFDIKEDDTKRLYIVGNMPSYTGATIWFENYVNLSDILVGGGDYSQGYPQAKLVSCNEGTCLNTDGGLPKGRDMTPIWAQFGGSGTNVRAVTKITSMTFDGVNVIK